MSIASAMRAGMMLGQGLGRRVDIYQAENELEEEEKQGVGIIDKAAETSFDDFQKRLKEQERVNANAVSQGLITQEYSDNELNKLRASAPALPSIRQGYNEDERARRLAQLYDAQLRSSGDSAYADQLRESRNADREAGIRMRGLEQTYQQKQKMNPLLVKNQQASNTALNMANNLTEQTFDSNVSSARSAAELAASQARVATQTEQDVIEAVGLGNEKTASEIDLNDQRYMQGEELFGKTLQKLDFELESMAADSDTRKQIESLKTMFNNSVTPGEGRRDSVNGIIQKGIPLFNKKFDVSGNDNTVKMDDATGDYFLYDQDGNKGTNITEYLMTNPEGLKTGFLYAISGVDPEKYQGDLTEWLKMQNQGDYWNKVGLYGRSGVGTADKMYQRYNSLTTALKNIDYNLANGIYETEEQMQAAHGRRTVLVNQMNGLAKQMSLVPGASDQPFDPRKVGTGDNGTGDNGTGDKTTTQKGLTRADYQNSGFNLPTTPGQLAGQAYNATVDAVSRGLIQPVGDTIAGINDARAQTQSDQKDVNYKSMAPGINDAFKRGLPMQQNTIDAMMREDPKYLLSVGIDPEIVIALQQLKMAEMQ